jgi:hypothetical protein
MGMASQVVDAQGVPEPGLVLQGKIFAQNGSQVTQGRLRWTFTPYSGTGNPVVVLTDLFPIEGATGTTYSYRVHIPAESAIAGVPISANCLPATTNLTVYRREATLDGGFTTIANNRFTTATFGYSERGKTERIDLVVGVGSPPGVPSSPSPANGQVLVPLNTTLDWADTARAQTYDVYLWLSTYTKPPAPTMSGLTASQYLPATMLRPDTQYSWQVVARNTRGSTAGPVWTFRTAFQGDLQTLLEYLLGKRYLTFQEQSALDLNTDSILDIADFARGLGRSSFSFYSLSRDARGQLTESTAAAAQVKGVPLTKAVSIGSASVTTSKTVAVTLPINVSPSVAGVAGINLKIEADPVLIEFTGVRPKQVNAGEFLYTYSPHSGVLHVVFFANPVAALKASSATLLWLDLKATLPARGSSAAIQLKVAAVSDVNGVSGTVTKSNGSVRLSIPTSPTFSRHWELYR